MTMIRKILVARTDEALNAQIGEHLSGSWQKVGRPIVQPPGHSGYGEYRQVMEKEVADWSPVSYFLEDDLAQAC
jgi:hypothetical protein